MENKGSKEVHEDEDAGLVDFNALPEGCISSIVSLTSPLDACTYSLISSVFKSAAESDSVWEKFIPSDYQEILARSSSVVIFSSKKDLYYSLCHNPILIDGGLKSFSLEKHSGKKCFMLGAKDLTITWGSTPHYWQWRPFPGSRFAEVAKLRDVCWLYIEGKMETRFLSPNTTYAVYFVFQFVNGACGFDDPPVKVIVEKLGEGGNIECRTEKDICLDPNGLLVGAHIRREAMSISMWEVSREVSMWEEEHFGQKRWDGWFEVEMGHFFNDGGEDDGGREVNMVLKEIAGGHWKAGLIVEGIELRPKENI